MYLELTTTQRLLAKAAADALGRQDTLTVARAALDSGERLDLWPLASEAGWTGLLSAEDVDGEGLGAYDAFLVLEACGARLADLGLIGHLPATILIEQGRPEDAQLRRDLASGTARAALVDGEVAGSTVRADGERISGTAQFVIDAPHADVLVVLAQGTPYLLSAAQATVVPKRSYDATRALATVAFENAEARELSADPATGRDLQRALLGAESVGAAQAALTMARDHAAQREAFGRTIGSYQAIKHKLTEMLRRVENGRSLMVSAGRSWQTADFTRDANALRSVATDALDYAAPENIFTHGGIGATWDHDAQLYYRRAEVSRRLAGGAEAAALAVADALLSAV